MIGRACTDSGFDHDHVYVNAVGTAWHVVRWLVGTILLEVILRSGRPPSTGGEDAVFGMETVGDSDGLVD